MQTEAEWDEWKSTRICEFCGESAADCEAADECDAWWIDLAKAREVVRRTLAAVVAETDRQADHG